MDKNVSEFYDTYVDEQKEFGLNIRHYSILDKLKKAGLTKDSTLLEMGCGTGFLTKLIASYAKNRIVATDLSKDSIAYAEKHNNKKNITWVAADSTEFKYNATFDFILLPDIIEHIPVDLHGKLFKTIKHLTHENTKICIHYPAAQFIEWCENNNSELMQIIDQQIDLNQLIGNLAKISYQPVCLSSYNLYTKDNFDYVWIIFEPIKKSLKFDFKKKLRIIIEKSIFRLKNRR